MVIVSRSAMTCMRNVCARVQESVVKRSLLSKVLKLIVFVLNSRKLALKILEFLVLVFLNMHYNYDVYECSL